MSSLIMEAFDYWEVDKIEKAIELFSQAVDEGYKDAPLCLGQLYMDEQNYEMAYTWYLEAFHAGNPQAAFNIAKMYFEGLYVDQDYKKAYEYFYISLDYGWENACYYLGYYAENGLDVVDVDYEEALDWYRRGISFKDSSCIRALAKCYEVGHGVNKNANTAKNLYRAAKEKAENCVGWDMDMYITQEIYDDHKGS